MIKRILTASALAVVITGPAWAVGPPCQDQLAALKPLMPQHQEAEGKYRQAEQLCNQNKDMEAQELAQQIRQQIGKTSTGAAGAEGSTAPSGAAHSPGTESK